MKRPCLDGCGRLTDRPDHRCPTAYGVYMELVSGSGALGSLHHTLKVGSKTTVDCIVTVNASAPLASVGVDILGVRTF